METNGFEALGYMRAEEMCTTTLLKAFLITLAPPTAPAPTFFQVLALAVCCYVAVMLLNCFLCNLWGHGCWNAELASTNNGQEQLDMMLMAWEDPTWPGFTTLKIRRRLIRLGLNLAE